MHSTVGFAVKHMVVSTFRGRFESYEATLVSAGDGGAQLTGTVDVRSTDVKPDIAAHLASPDFFDADNHPQMRFASTALRRDGDRLEVDGELTIRGVTQRVTASGTMTDAHEDPWGAVRMGVELGTVIDRRQYGLEWNLPLPKGGFALAEEVQLDIHLEFVRS